MKNKKKSPITSFGSFEELAQNLEGFDYEKANQVICTTIKNKKIWQKVNGKY